MSDGIEFEQRSGNVFADLELPDAEEMLGHNDLSSTQIYTRASRGSMPAPIRLEETASEG